MSASDQNIADQDLPQPLVQLLQYQCQLGAAHEKLQRHQLRQLEFTAAELTRLNQYEQLCQQLSAVHRATQFDVATQLPAMLQFLQTLQQHMPQNDVLFQ